MDESTNITVEQAVARLQKTEATVHAYAHLDTQRAQSTAAELADVTSPGPLHGWPFAVKEVVEVAGIPTPGGCQVFSDHVPDEDATVVQRLRDAGAILLGTQVSHELTCGLDEPKTRNPWDTACYPGGSSAGAGVSVAVGSARFALGTDAAGSVRIPAAMTGTVGLKPTAGMVSKSGITRFASAPSIDNVGIIARTALDVEQVFNVISGPDPADASTLHGMAEDSAIDIDLRNLRVAVLGRRTRDLLDEVWPVEYEIDMAFEAVCDFMSDSGVHLVDIEVPSLENAISAVVTFFSTELAVAHRDLVEKQAESYHPDVLGMLRESLQISTADVAEAVRVRASLTSEIRAAFGSADVRFLMTPTTARSAMPLATFDPPQELGSLIPYTCGFNLSGQPAISVPCGLTSSGLPIGLQFVALHCLDRQLLRLAQSFQEGTSWHKKTPPI